MRALTQLARMRRRGGRDGIRTLMAFGAGAGAALLATFFDRRRRHIARDRVMAAGRDLADTADRKAQYAAGVATGVAHTVTSPLRREDREYDDVTLARKVETELFRPADAPKASVSINAQHGVVELRGEVKRPEDIKALGDAAAKVEGVKGVNNLLHTPGSPPKHTPPSDPEEVRGRFARTTERETETTTD